MVEPALVLASPAYADLARRACAQCDHRGAAARCFDRRRRVGAAGRSRSRRSSARGRDDLAVLLFTAGTAGAPKPAMLTHGSLLANLEQMQSHPGLRVAADRRRARVLPLFHVFGLNVVLGLALHRGRARCRSSTTSIPTETLARVRNDARHGVAGVPAIFDAWLGARRHRRARRRVRARAPLRLRRGAAAADDRRGDARALRRRRARRLRAHRSVARRHDERGRRPSRAPGSIGPPLPGVEVRLVDRDGHDVLEGDPGEIIVRGPNVFAGYWRDPDATARACCVDGWLHTGDIGVAGADGWLSLVDRAKDVIIVSGFNVYPGRGRGRARAATATSPTSR